MKPSLCSQFFVVLSLLFSQAVAAEAINVAGAAEDNDRLGEAVAAGDFNCDGYDDLAIGMPGEDNDSGAINIVYGGVGSYNKLGSTGNRLFKQGEFWNAEAGDRFGAVLAAGDFDRDNCDDLAIGIPGEDLNSIVDAGGVVVAYGGTGGINPGNSEVWTQDVMGVSGVAEAYDGFGGSLATGDFDNDGYDDLAIGVPYEAISSTAETGAVNVLYGGSSGLSPAFGEQLFHQDTSGVAGTAETFDHFGFSLAAGDFDGDGYDDLAIGVPGDTVNGHEGAGGVNVLYGSANKLSTSNDQWWSQDEPGVLGVAYSAEEFGYSLAVGDFDGDGYDDLAVGVPDDNIFDDFDIRYVVGGVNVLYGSGAGLSSVGDELWDTKAFGDEQPFVDIELGSVLAAGDFDDDGRDDLAIGIPLARAHSAAPVASGHVRVIYGTANGLFGSDQHIHQDTAGVLNGADHLDYFGSALAVGDFDNSGYDDLVVGVPGEDNTSNTIIDGGVVQVFYGTVLGVYPAINQLFVQ